MKRCPRCNLKYDDTLSFCLEDGTGLIRANDPDDTLVLPDTKPHPMLAPKEVQQPAISREPVAQRLSSRLLYGMILLLAIFAAGVTVALFYERDKPAANAPAQSTSPNTTQTQIPAQQPRSSPPPLVANSPRTTAADTTATPKSKPVRCGTVIFCVGGRTCAANLDEKLVHCSGQGYDAITEVQCDGANFRFTRPGDHNALVRGTATNSRAVSGTYFESDENRSIACRQ